MLRVGSATAGVLCRACWLSPAERRVCCNPTLPLPFGEEAIAPVTAVRGIGGGDGGGCGGGGSGVRRTCTCWGACVIHPSQPIAVVVWVL